MFIEAIVDGKRSVLFSEVVSISSDKAPFQREYGLAKYVAHLIEQLAKRLSSRKAMRPLQLSGYNSQMSAFFLLAVLLGSQEINARSMPTIDTEDDTLGAVDVSSGRLHPTIGLDIRNGDFARGGYDDDAANLNRLPLHLQIGFGLELNHRMDGAADVWLVGTSSNGLHAPASYERESPRAWYESNNLVGIAFMPIEGLIAAGAYTIKTSPNRVAGTSHEASVTAAFNRHNGIGVLHPNAAITFHTIGGRGFFTQIGIEPSVNLSKSPAGPKLRLPLKSGIGWDNFYGGKSQRAFYTSGGIGLSQPISIQRTSWNIKLEALMIFRGKALRNISVADLEEGRIVPLVTIGISKAF